MATLTCAVSDIENHIQPLYFQGQNTTSLNDSNLVAVQLVTNICSDNKCFYWQLFNVVVSNKHRKI